MNTAFWLSLVLGVVGITGIRLAGKGKWQGWALGLAVQPVWFVFALVTKGYGLLLICFGYAYVYGTNLLEWRREATSKKTPHPKTKPVVFAGDHRQAMRWIDANNLTLQDAVVASSKVVLEGLRFTRDDVVFVGNYYDRHDFRDIMDLIERNDTLYSYGKDK